MTIISNREVSESLTPTEPVSLDDAKAWAMVDHDDQDDLLTSMIIGAREDIEQELGLKLVDATASFYLETTREDETVTQFPYAFGLNQVSDLEVSWIYDGEIDSVLTEDDDYYFNGRLKVGDVGRYNVVYSITPVVPTAIKEAIKMLVTYRFLNRGDQEKQQGLPEDIERKISRWRQTWL